MTKTQRSRAFINPRRRLNVKAVLFFSFFFLRDENVETRIMCIFEPHHRRWSAVVLINMAALMRSKISVQNITPVVRQLATTTATDCCGIVQKGVAYSVV